MNPKTLYQTLEDRDNHIVVEEHGPFLCKWDNTWLGEGYYFWDTFYEIAEWWGEIRYPDNYMVCSAECDFDSEKCFDLVGEPEHIKEFREILNQMSLKGLINDQTTVSRVIKFLMDELKCFKYEATRVSGINSINNKALLNSKYVKQLKFEIGKNKYMDLLPPIQICIYKKTGLNLRNYKVIYPDHYREDYSA